MIHTTYGEGGYDETKPNNNIIDQFDDGIEEQVESKQIPTTALTELASKLNDPTVNSIAEIKAALKDFVSSIE